MSNQDQLGRPEGNACPLMLFAIWIALTIGCAMTVGTHPSELWPKMVAPFAGLALAGILPGSPPRMRCGPRAIVPMRTDLAAAVFFGTWLAPMTGREGSLISLVAGICFMALLPDILVDAGSFRRQLALAITYAVCVTAGVIALPALIKSGNAGWMIAVASSCALATAQVWLMRLPPFSWRGRSSTMAAGRPGVDPGARQ